MLAVIRSKAINNINWQRSDSLFKIEKKEMLDMSYPIPGRYHKLIYLFVTHTRKLNNDLYLR